MRVITGRCKGRVLYSPKSKLIRPTSDKIKEFIFDYIGEKIPGVIVDSSTEAIRLIYRNLALTNFLSQSKIVKQDVFRYLKKAIQQQDQFNLIFADPPYSNNDYQSLIDYVGSNNFLQKGGFFILEHSSHKNLDAQPVLLSLMTTKVFGDTAITFYKQGGD
jgi:16S rRNA (guanine966-N2)-methyltransferase